MMIPDDWAPWRLSRCGRCLAIDCDHNGQRGTNMNRRDFIGVLAGGCAQLLMPTRGWSQEKFDYPVALRCRGTGLADLRYLDANPQNGTVFLIVHPIVACNAGR